MPVLAIFVFAKRIIPPQPPQWIPVVQMTEDQISMPVPLCVISSTQTLQTAISNCLNAGSNLIYSGSGIVRILSVALGYIITFLNCNILQPIFHPLSPALRGLSSSIPLPSPRQVVAEVTAAVVYQLVEGLTSVSSG